MGRPSRHAVNTGVGGAGSRWAFGLRQCISEVPESGCPRCSPRHGGSNARSGGRPVAAHPKACRPWLWLVQLERIGQMSSDWIVAVPPSAKSCSPSLLALGKIWSVITRWPWSAKTSTEDQSTRMRRRTRAVAGGQWRALDGGGEVAAEVRPARPRAVDVELAVLGVVADDRFLAGAGADLQAGLRGRAESQRGPDIERLAVDGQDRGSLRRSRGGAGGTTAATFAASAARGRVAARAAVGRRSCAGRARVGRSSRCATVKSGSRWRSSSCSSSRSRCGGRRARRSR